MCFWASIFSIIISYRSYSDQSCLLVGRLVVGSYIHSFMISKPNVFEKFGWLG